MLKSLAAIALICSTLFAAADFARAQGEESRELPRRLQYTSRVVSVYDPLEGRTRLELRPLMGVYQSDGVAIQIYPVATFQGHTPLRQPARIALCLIFSSRTRVRVSDSNLYITTNGAPVEAGEMELSTETALAGNGQMLGYVLLISFDTGRRMASANSIEMRFNGIAFNLTQDHRSAITDFLNYAEGR
jgi:hypothetical protein